jgi:hypothetical protein
MKNVLMSVVVIATLVTAGVGGTFAGFVDTEVSQDNFVQAGISDLLVNGKNDPDVPAKIQFDHIVPCKSTDFWVDLYNWGECSGGDVYMHVKDVLSEEAGTKFHLDAEYVFDNVTQLAGIPKGYRVAVGAEPKGAGVWSSEPEMISEVGGGWIAQYFIADNDTNLLDEDYASGIADHLDFMVEVPLVGTTGNILGNPDTNRDGVVSSTESANWTAQGNRWEIIDSLSGKLADIECNKNHLGFLETQKRTYVHVDVHLQQLYADEWGTVNPAIPSWTGPGVDYDGDGDVDADDFQKACWPTNALQGDKASWDMLFELITDP